MPRKETGEKLERVVSTKISLEDFMLLEKYAKIGYDHSLLTQPTISHQIRYILKKWAYFRRVPCRLLSLRFVLGSQGDNR